MRIAKAVGRSLTASVTLTMVAACAGGTFQATPASLGRLNTIPAMSRGLGATHSVATPSYLDRDAVGKPLVFVSDTNGNVVDIYRQHGNKMVGQITGFDFPTGLATDAARNLYVTTGSSVAVYAPPYNGAPSLTLDDNGYFPNGVAISSLGVVAVTNFCNAPSCSNGTGNVMFYAPHSTTPCVTVTDAVNFGQAFFDTFDDKGNLYITGERTDQSANNIGVVKGGCQAKKIKLLTLPGQLGGVPSIRVDKHDRIAITGKSGSTYAIITFEPPKNGVFGNPVSTTPLTTSTTPAYDFAFTASGRDLYASNDFSPAAAYKYDYPTGGAAEQTINVGGAPWGVAVSPALRP